MPSKKMRPKTATVIITIPRRALRQRLLDEYGELFEEIAEKIGFDKEELVDATLDKYIDELRESSCQ